MMLSKAAAVTLAVVGLDQSQEHETGTRTQISLPGVQQELLQQLRETTDTLVVLLVGGSALAVEWCKARADALLWIGSDLAYLVLLQVYTFIAGCIQDMVEKRQGRLQGMLYSVYLTRQAGSHSPCTRALSSSHHLTTCR